MIINLPVIHKAVETFLQRLEGETSVDRALALVEATYGREAAEQLEAGEVDENLDYALWDLAHKVEDDVEPMVFAHLLSASLPQKVFTLEVAYELYAKFKDVEKGGNKNLQKYLNRSKADLIQTLGKVTFSETPLIKITRINALAYRDTLLDRVSPASTERYITTVKAVVNHSIDELGLSGFNNPFNRLKVKGAGATKGDRLSLSEVDVMAVRDAIPSEDLLALYEALVATGARLAEVSGSFCGDVDLQHRTFHIRANDIRGLKTQSSERVLPLSDKAFDLLFALKHGREDTEPLFTRYGRPDGNTACSAALMKHLRKVVTERKKTIHSLRHRKADQLRAVECPEEIRKALLGHSNREVAARYGDGHSLEIMKKWLSKTWG
jgi:integrase